MGFAGQATIQPAQLVLPVPDVIQPIAFTAFDVVGVTPEALLVMNRNLNFGVPSAASTYTVPDQMELRIGSVVLNLRESTVAATPVAFIFRIRTGALVTGNEIAGWSCRNRTETGPQNLAVTLSEPLIIPQNQQICFTSVVNSATVRFDVTLLGRLKQL